MKKFSKRLLTFLLAVTMTITMSYNPVYAQEALQTGLCEHHTAHTADCGYTEGTAGSACSHEHTADCYTTEKNCSHEHTGDCYSQAENSNPDDTETPSGSEGQAPDACTHVCSEETGCITEQLNCHHEHDDQCGYAEETSGSSCSYVCEICNSQDDNEEVVEDEDEETEEAEETKETEDTLTVEEIQAMIDALPEKITKKNAEEVEELLAAIDEAKAKLTDKELKQLDLTRYEKVIALLGELSTPMLTAAETGDIWEVDYGYGNKSFDNWPELIDWIDGINDTTTTITLLDDATITSPLTFPNVLLGDIIFDLDGHTLSGDIADGPIIDVNPTTIRKIGIQNGTIINTHEDGRAIYLADGKLTLKDISATGDVVLGKIYNSTGNYVPTFLGGGTFSKIYAENYNVNLSIILSPGCYVLDANGQRLDANPNYSSLENVTIKSCDHKNEAGEYTFVKEAGKFVCTICGNVCRHTDLTQDERMCLACGSEITATMTSMAPIRHYTSFSEAADDVRNRRGNRTVHLLCDQDSSRLIFSDQFTINFNGFRLCQTADETVVENALSFQNMDSDYAGHYVGTLLVTGTSNPIGIIKVPAENNDLRIDGLVFTGNGRAELSGGTFGSITMSGSATLKSLLNEGYYFKSADGKPVQITTQTSLTEVTVTPCDHACGVFRVHDEASGTDTFTCPCGQKTFGASVTKDGQEAYYQTLQEAFDAATTGSTVKLLSKPTANATTLEVRSDITFDLNGQDLSSGAGLALNGKVTLIGSSAGSNLGIPVTVKSGAKMTVPATYSDSTANQLTLKKAAITVANGGVAELNTGTNENCSVTVSGRLTVTGGSYGAITLKNGSEMDLRGGSCTSLSAEDQGKAAVSGGKIGEFHITGGYSGITISDGSFDRIILYEYDLSTGEQFRTVTYADFAALPESGKSFRRTDNTWINYNDVKEGDNYTSKPCKVINNVTVGTAPLKGVTAYSQVASKDYMESVSVEYGEEISLKAQTQFQPGSTPSVTYQWYEVDADGSRTKAGSASSDGTCALPKTLTLGAHTYVVEANCSGYLCYSEPYTVTVTPRILLKPTAVESTLTKVYDGTTDATVRIAGFVAKNATSAPAIQLTSGTDYTVSDMYYDTANAGTTTVNLTVTLKNSNYQFEDGDTQTAKIQNAAITQASAPTVSKNGDLTICNNTAATYHFDFKSLLPELNAPESYGTITGYTIDKITLTNDYYTDGATIADGVLSLPIEQYTTILTAPVGTVTVKVSTQNYQDFILTLNVSAANKIQPVLNGNVILSKTTLTYGQKLSAVTISGTMKDGSTTVKGRFAWQSPDEKLNASENAHTVGWIFIPDDPDKYAEVTGTTTITVNKAVPAGAPKYTPVTGPGKTLSDVNLTANDSWPDGTLQWMDGSYLTAMPEQTEVTANTPYYWEFAPYDTANYTVVRGNLKPYTTSDGGSSSGGNSHNDSSSGDDSTSDDSLVNTDSPNANQNNGSSSNGDSSNSNSSSGSGSSTNIGSSAQPEPSLPTTVTAKPVTLDTRGRVTVDHNTVLSAIEEARNAAKKNGTLENGIAVTIPVTPRKGQTSFQVSLKAQTLDVLVRENVKQLEINLDGVSAQCMDIELLKWLDSLSADGDIILRTKQVNRLTSAEAKRAIGNRPVYDLSLSYLANGKNVSITSLNGHTISIRLPYTPTLKEQNGSLFAVYVDNNGKVEWIINSSYNENLGAVVFETSHFSIYGVGYQKPGSSFKDISVHWAKDNIIFAASRDLLSGTGKRQFSPDAGITRGALAAALGKMAGIDPADYKTGKFIDVPATASYAPYVNWAAGTGIISTTNKITFAPDAGVTREQLAVILTNYAKTMGYDLPAAHKTVPFADQGQISSPSKTAVSTTQQAGILPGKDGNRFDPQTTATRAETATALRRFIETVIDPQTAQGWVQNHNGKWNYYRNGMMVVNTTVDGYKIGPDGARK